MANNPYEFLVNIIIKFIIAVLLISPHLVTAVNLDTPISQQEKSQFDQILTPVMKIYNLIKYTASVVAVIALLFAGISYMFSGNDIRKRDTSKNMAAYVIIGLVIIWAAPFMVNLLIT